jgi:hypothetical protein
VESISRVNSGIKWFQPPLDRSCGGLNRGSFYQVQRQKNVILNYVVPIFLDGYNIPKKLLMDTINVGHMVWFR